MKCPRCSADMNYAPSRDINYPAVEIPGLGVRPAYSDLIPSGFECLDCNHWVPFWMCGEYPGVANAS